MDYDVEIKKHEKAIKQLKLDREYNILKNKYVIFACINFHNNKKYYYTNYRDKDLVVPLDNDFYIKECLFTYQQAIDFANQSCEPQILKESIRPANQEIYLNIDVTLLNI